jgi:cytochrome b561
MFTLGRFTIKTKQIELFSLLLSPSLFLFNLTQLAFLTQPEFSIYTRICIRYTYNTPHTHSNTLYDLLGLCRRSKQLIRPNRKKREHRTQRDRHIHSYVNIMLLVLLLLSVVVGWPFSPPSRRLCSRFCFFFAS